MGEIIFVKQVVDSVRMTTWSRSYYQNVLAAAPLTLIALATNEAGHVTRASFTPTAVAVLLASSVAGLGMSYYSFALRSVISATSFSVVGNVCKVGTILVSCLVLEQHGSERGRAEKKGDGLSAPTSCVWHDQKPIYNGLNIKSTVLVTL